MSDEVLFTQKLVSKDNDNKVTIEWMVENNTGGLIENALALSQCYTHDLETLKMVRSNQLFLM